MRGYTVKKGNRYYAVIYDGIDPRTGKERRRWIAAGTRLTAAEKLVNDLVKRRNDGEPTNPDKITFGAYLTDRWLPIQRSQLRPSTYNSYKRNLELHVIPMLGRIKLAKLAPEDLDVLYAELLVNGKLQPKPAAPPAGLSAKTVRSIHLIIHKALADATRKGSVVRNVAALADAPKVGARKRAEIKVWTVDQLRTYLAAMQPKRLHPAYHLTAYTGMRRGEVLGLRWSDVDLDAARLSVNQALILVDYEMQISDVKTGNGRRAIDLDPTTVEVLRTWRETRISEAGKRACDGLVFVKDNGDPINPDYFSQLHDRTVAKIKLPRITFHDLRHTHATLLLKAGVPVKVVSERLGHANAAFTMTVYQHLIPGMQAEAANTFADMLNKPDDPDSPVPAAA